MTQQTLSQPDHDMLIIINTKLDVFTGTLATVQAQQASDRAAWETRLTALERSADRQAGLLSGGKFLWAIIGALPPSVVAILFGLSTK